MNACAAMVVIYASARGGWLAPVAWSGLPLATSPSFAGIVGLSLISLMCVTAYAVSVPVENARAATRFQEGLAQIALTLQRSGGGKEALATVCGHANEWFGVDRTQIALLEGEDQSGRGTAHANPSNCAQDMPVESKGPGSPTGRKKTKACAAS